jgi:hypothetical protein
MNSKILIIFIVLSYYLSIWSNNICSSRIQVWQVVSIHINLVGFWILQLRIILDLDTIGFRLDRILIFTLDFESLSVSKRMKSDPSSSIQTRSYHISFTHATSTVYYHCTVVSNFQPSSLVAKSDTNQKKTLDLIHPDWLDSIWSF